MENDPKHGGWNTFLPTDRFEVSEKFTFGNTYYMRSYCKTLPEPPTTSPTIRPESDTLYDFPPVTTDYFLHGICVLDAFYAEVTSTDPDLHYTMVEDFQDGVKLWDNANYYSKNVVGEAACQGGVYLRPSLIQVRTLFILRFIPIQKDAKILIILV